MANNKRHIFTIDQVYALAIAGELENVTYDKRREHIKGVNGNDLRTLPRKQEKKQSHNNNLDIITGKMLSKYVINNTQGYKERFLISELMNFLNSPCTGKICALYGLRRTGKTVMMLHGIKRLLSQNITDVAYITLTEASKLSALYRVIDKLIKKGIRYIFIDEITAVNGFIQSSALLSDVYAKYGVHLVIAGTDSFVLELAGRNNLYDRMYKINTTYIGYKEYSYLMGGTSILEYIRMGGVLPADIFYDSYRTHRYIDTAISNNIINSLLRAHNEREYGHLLELESRGLLKKAIEQAIMLSNNELTAQKITAIYKNGELGSAKELMEAVFDIDGTLDTEEIEDKVRYRLSIVKQFDTDINPEYIEELKDFLEEIGVTKSYFVYANGKEKKVTLFVQPGLRYNQTTELLRELCNSESFFDIPKKIRDDFFNKIIQDVEGNLMEHEAILSELIRFETDKQMLVTQVDYQSKEIDMALIKDNTASIFEIKRSSKVVEQQCKWLINKEINNHIEKFFGCKIINRNVLYLGDNKRVTINGIVVDYININKFISR